MNNPVYYLTKKEVAEKLRVSVSTIDNYRRRGVLQGYRPPQGRVVLFKSTDVDQLLTVA